MVKFQRQVLREIIIRHGAEAGERVDPFVELLEATRGELANLPELDAEPRAWNASQSAMLTEWNAPEQDVYND
jgi:hypothetical protein